MSNAPNKPQNAVKPTEKTQDQRPAADRDQKDRDQKDRDQKGRDQKGGHPGSKPTTGGHDRDRNPGNKMPASGDEKAARDREDTADAGAAENEQVSGRNAKSGAPIELADGTGSRVRNDDREGDGPSGDDARRHAQASQNAAKAAEKAGEKKDQKKS